MKKVQPHTAVLEIGTKSLRLVVIEQHMDATTRNIERRVVASTSVPIEYIKRGIVQDADALTLTIRTAISNIHKIHLAKIERVVVSLTGTGVGSIANHAEYHMRGKISTVTAQVIEDLVEKIESKIPENIIQNKKVVHTVPQEFRIDGKKVSSLRPIGMSGSHFEMRALCIFVLKQHLENVLYACEENNLEVEDVIVGHYAYSKKQVREADRLAGVCIVNIGADTTSVITYDEGIPLLLEILPIGSQDITKDLALGLKVTLSQAEAIKIAPTTGLQKLATELTEVLIKKQKTNIRREQREKAVFLSLEERYHEIVYARLIDIFEVVQQHLKKVHRERLLPAGVLISGGGSNVQDVDIIAKEILHLPVQITKDAALFKSLCKHKNADVSAHGCDCLSVYMSGVFYLDHDETEHMSGHKNSGGLALLFKRFIAWIKQFLP